MRTYETPVLIKREALVTITADDHLWFRILGFISPFFVR